jgi:antitoxin component YwqK of YwqJK toxin-antitoxin module
MNENTYYEDGRIKDGIVIIFYNNDKIMKETPYKDGEINGIQKEYTFEGNISVETPYIDGLINGIVKLYFTNGPLMEEVPYKNGKIEGIRKRYFISGEIEEESEYHRDIKSGLTIHYYVDGTVEYEQEYEKGKLVDKHKPEEKTIIEKNSSLSEKDKIKLFQNMEH